MLARIYNKVHSCKDGSAHEDDALNPGMGDERLDYMVETIRGFCLAV